MKFLPRPLPKPVHHFGCGVSLSGDASPDRMSCGSPVSDVPSECDDHGPLGASRSRSDVDIRRGVLVAHTNLVVPRREICLLPFRVSLISSRLTWDPSRIIQIGGAHVAILADAAPWPELYGREFAPIDDSWWWNAAPGGVQSTLSLAALMGHLLYLGTPPDGDGISPIEHLLSKFTPPDLSFPLSAREEEVRHVHA